MSDDTSKSPARNKTESPPGDADDLPAAIPDGPRTREIGGRAGPDPTRYGDWEKDGRCIDF